jgi:hypothetical protein
VWGLIYFVGNKSSTTQQAPATPVRLETIFVCDFFRTALEAANCGE